MSPFTFHKAAKTLKMTAWLRHVVRRGRSRNPGRQRATGNVPRKTGSGHFQVCTLGMERKDISLTTPGAHPKEAQKLSNILNKATWLEPEKSCVKEKKKSLFWLIFESGLAAPRQTVGLAKTHLRQEGWLRRGSAGGCSGLPFQLFPFLASTHKAGPGPASPRCWGPLYLSELFGCLMESPNCPQAV